MTDFPLRAGVIALVAAVALSACASKSKTMHADMMSKSAESMPWAMTDHDDPVASAHAAAPASLARNATIRDWEGEVLREGSNGWTCLPDNPGTPGTDPWCITGPWDNLLSAYMAREAPDYDRVGVAYMLAGDTAVSNTDPFATEFTTEEDWVTGLGAHLMVVVPGENSLAGFSEDPDNGGPWIMWPGTPYEHLMIPIDSVE